MDNRPLSQREEYVAYTLMALFLVFNYPYLIKALSFIILMRPLSDIIWCIINYLISYVHVTRPTNYLSCNPNGECTRIS